MKASAAFRDSFQDNLNCDTTCHAVTQCHYAASYIVIHNLNNIDSAEDCTRTNVDQIEKLRNFEIGQQEILSNIDSSLQGSFKFTLHS